MPIIVTRKGSAPAALIEKSSFGKEDNIQQYIHQYPEAIPIYDIRNDKRLFVAAREFATASGPIDALAVDKDGDIYVIETKLYANADKRRVVAQALDYGASLWKHFSDFAAFVRLLDTHAQSQWGMGFQQKARQCLSLDEIGAETMLDQMQSNLRSGNLKFVVLMNSIDERLKELIAYVNLKSQSDICAVELEHYEYEDYKIVLPKLYGAETKKDNPPPSQKSAITEGELLTQIAGDDPARAKWADTLCNRLRAEGFKSQASSATLSYGVDVNGRFAPLIGFQGRNVYAALRIAEIRALGGERFVRYKQMMNTLGPFYGTSDANDPTKSTSKGPGYGELTSNLDSFVATVKSIADMVRSTFQETPANAV
jgi:hypothetical protein